ncbi:hypothetical protein E1H18_2669 [Caulobacter sp. RHG1]|nr:hypothetical protein [Caulobacter sp. RHG1]
MRRRTDSGGDLLGRRLGLQVHAPDAEPRAPEQSRPDAGELRVFAGPLRHRRHRPGGGAPAIGRAGDLDHRGAGRGLAGHRPGFAGRPVERGGRGDDPAVPPLSRRRRHRDGHPPGHGQVAGPAVHRDRHLRQRQGDDPQQQGVRRRHPQLLDPPHPARGRALQGAAEN